MLNVSSIRLLFLRILRSDQKYIVCTRIFVCFELFFFSIATKNNLSLFFVQLLKIWVSSSMVSFLNFFFLMDNLFAGLTGMHHGNFINELDYATCDSSCASVSHKSKYSNSSSSGTDCSEQPSCQYSLLESTPKNFQLPLSPPKNFQSNCNNLFTK